MPKKAHFNRNNFNLVVPVFILIATILMLVSNGLAVTITVDKDGTADYDSLDILMKFINDDTPNDTEYTILFTGNNQHTYEYSTVIHNHDSLTFNITGESSDPREFPILRISQDIDLFKLHETNNVHYKNIIFQGPYDLKSGQNADYQLTFYNCLFRGFTSENGAVLLETDKNKIIRFTNCIFSKNDTALKLHFWGNGPKISIMNCVFDGNGVVFSADLPDNEEYSITIKNSIFLNNSPLPMGGNLKLQMTKVLVSNSSDTTGCGGDCIFESDPRFVSKDRSQPRDWQLQPTSQAINKGDSAGAPKTDFGGNLRSVPFDIGAWEFAKDSLKLGYESDNIIPASKVVQARDGTGEITVNFKARDPEGRSVKLSNFSYTVDGNTWVPLDTGSKALPANWNTRSFASGPDYTQAPNQSFIFYTKQVPELKDSVYTEVNLQFSGTSDEGQNNSPVRTESFELDNKPPVITWKPPEITYEIPSLKGGSNELLDTLMFIINKDTLWGKSINEQSWSITEDTLPDLAPGTYDVKITATDSFGNETILEKELVITDTSALKVTVNPQKTSLRSPPFTGTVSHENAEVTVKINEEPIKADSIKEGKWSIPANTFKDLSAGTHTIIARAKLGDRKDTSTAKVTILDRLPPPSLQDHYANEPQPEITGGQEDWEAKVFFYLTGKAYQNEEYQGINNKDGTILLQAGSLPKLKPDIYKISVTTKTTDDSTSDSARLYIDFTEPEGEFKNPNKEPFPVIKPTLEFVFNEKITKKNGSVRIFQEGTKAAIQTIGASAIKILSDSVAQIIPNDTLEAESSYYVHVDSTLFADKAGNLYPGIKDDTSWQFQTMALGEPRIDSITSDSSALFKAGDIIKIKLHFNDSLELDSGGMQLVLNAGGQPIPVPGFKRQESVEVKYMVQRGDHSDALDVQFIGNGPVNKNGKRLARNLSGDAKLTSRYTIRVDGIAPVVTLISPQQNTSILKPSVEYELSEDVEIANIAWERDGEQPKAFRLDEKKAGERHSKEIEAGILNRDRIYHVTLTVWDSAGNKGEGTIDSLKLVSLQGLNIHPADIEVGIGESVQFAIRNSEGDSITDLNHVDWKVYGPGGIDNGIFKGKGIGKCTVSVKYEDWIDSAHVHIVSRYFAIDKTGGDIIQVSPSAKIILTNLTTPAGDSNLVVLPNSIPEGFRPAGPALEFSKQNAGFIALSGKVTLKLRLDPKNNTNKPDSLIRAYYKKDALWYLHKQKPDTNGWFHIETDTLTSYLVGVDTSAPTVALKDTTQKPLVGQPLKFSWQANDNIANANVNLRVFQGRDTTGTPIPLIFKNGREAWGSIPDTLMDSLGIWYRVEISDGVSDPVFIGKDVMFTRPEQKAPEKFLNERYDMISFPLDVEDRSIKTLLKEHLGDPDDKVWRLFDWQGEETEWVDMVKENATLQAGRAYWLHTRIKDTVTFSLDSGAATLPLSKPFQLLLEREGWHCFSNPFPFNIPVSWVKLVKDTNTRVAVYEPDNDSTPWPTPDSLAPWKGYAVLSKVEIDTLKIFPVDPSNFPADSAASKKGSGKRGAGQGKLIKLSARNGPHRDGILEAGFGFPDCSAGEDRRDIPKPPVPEQMFDISFEMAWSPGTPFLTDYRGKLGDGQNWRLGVTSKSGGAVKLVVRGKDSLPVGLGMVLFDRSRGRVMRFFSDKVSFAAEPDKRDVFELAIGTKDYLEEQTAVFLRKNLKFSLLQSKPNPMRQSAVIEYSIPWSDGVTTLPVSLFIYNGKGRLVRKLVDGTRSPGWHKATWRGLDEGGAPLPAGMYLYRLECGKFEFGRKLLLLP